MPCKLQINSIHLFNFFRFPRKLFDPATTIVVFIFSEFLFPSQNSQTKEIRQVDGQYEKFTQIEKTIKLSLASMVKNAPIITQPAESMLAGSLAMALCYIARLQREKPAGSKLNARILLLTGSLECASQYMTYMNVFFTAQKQNVVLDVCALDESMTLLQQGCDITGGQYLKLPQTDGLLQYLLVRMI